MSKQQCEICGQWKEQQEMAKSYKHRCKECVARLTRIDRKAAKQRAENLKQQLEGTGYTLFSPEDRRNERILIASFAMQGMIANNRFYDALLDKSDHAKALAVTSLKFADALLAEVDNKKNEKGGCDD